MACQGRHPVRPCRQASKGRVLTAPLRSAHPQSELSRRGVLRGAAVAGVAAAVPLQFIVPPSAGAAGGPDAWFLHQRNPSRLPDHATHVFVRWFPRLHRNPRDHWTRHEKQVGYPYQVAADYGRWTLLRRMYSRRQVHEMMSEFWLNHLHVFSNADLTWMWRHGYDALIRKHALGRFDQMLQAAIIHPTMLTYLDADVSMVVRSSAGVVELINENLGRELLELHTVGRTAGYTESMVKDSAYILTGWTIDRMRTWARSYEPNIHYTGPVSVLEFSSPNDQRDGRQVLRNYLQYLAHHRATAQRIARKLAVRFVSDTPSQRLVDHLATVFRNSGTDIKTTLRALVRDREFKGSAGDKVRTPTDDMAATVRALGATMVRPRRETDAARAIFHLSSNIGQTPFGWGPPDGFPQTADAWATPGRLMGSFQVHNSMAGHWYPSTGIRYRPHSAWLPRKRIRFDLLVDHLCRTLHGKSVTSNLLGAACVCLGVKPNTVVTQDSFIVRYRMPHLIGLLLDTPEFLTR